jgi:phosphate starvation-inducible PhoH-like protein
VTQATTVTRRVEVPPSFDLFPLLGRNDEHLRTLETQYDVRVTVRGQEILIRGEERQVAEAERVVQELVEMLRAKPALGEGQVRAALRLAGSDPGADLKAVLAEGIPVPSRRKLVTPKTANQRRYVEAIRAHDLVVAIGPAGTGKSYLAVAMAVAALTRREVARIVLTRPAVEAGERLGFLPGDLVEKVHPYLRPLYDALYDMLEPERVMSLTEKGAIEIAPLAYMRGRTLNDAFIILDEAQNTTSEQMKMFLTRLGFSSKMVITGDITQIDLPPSRPSGLVEIQTVLQGIEGIRFVYFNDRDVVRHDLVSAIVRAYDRVQGTGRPAPAPEGEAPRRPTA